MQENSEKNGWKNVEQSLASEIIGRREEVSRVKNFAIACLTAAAILSTAIMAAAYYKNDCEWRKKF